MVIYKLNIDAPLNFVGQIQQSAVVNSKNPILLFPKNSNKTILRNTLLDNKTNKQTTKGRNAGIRSC